MLKAVIFDLDGVIIDSEPLMRFAFEEVYRQYIGRGKPPIDLYLEHMGESFPQIMDHLGLPHTLWEPYRRLCQKHIDRISLFPESRVLLNRLRELELKLALLTGKDMVRTLQILEHFDLQGLFQEVVTSDQLSYPKPNPEGILTIIKRLNCQASDAVMIGDAVSDILCARQAGVTSIAITWGIKPERVQTLCQPDHIVHNWETLTQLLLSLWQLASPVVGNYSRA